METKSYCLALVAVIDYCFDNDASVVSLSVGAGLAGDYWPRVLDAFSASGSGVASASGDFFVSLPQRLAPLYADAKVALSEIAKAEADRELDIRHKRENIRYGRRAFVLSIIAILVSIAAVLLPIML